MFLSCIVAFQWSYFIINNILKILMQTLWEYNVGLLVCRSVGLLVCWSVDLSEWGREGRSKNRRGGAKNSFSEINQPEMFDSVCLYPIKLFIENLKSFMLLDQQNRLKESCKTFPKLRTFVEIKDFYNTSPCLTLALSSSVKRR